MILQDVTVLLPEEIVRQARQLAVDRGMSLPEYLAALIEQRVSWSRRSRATRQPQPPRPTAEAGDQGTGEIIPWTRGDPQGR